MLAPVTPITPVNLCQGRVKVMYKHNPILGVAFRVCQSSQKFDVSATCEWKVMD